MLFQLQLFRLQSSCGRKHDLSIWSYVDSSSFLDDIVTQHVTSLQPSKFKPEACLQLSVNGALAHSRKTFLFKKITFEFDSVVIVNCVWTSSLYC